MALYILRCDNYITIYYNYKFHIVKMFLLAYVNCVRVDVRVGRIRVVPDDSGVHHVLGGGGERVEVQVAVVALMVR